MSPNVITAHRTLIASRRVSTIASQFSQSSSLQNLRPVTRITKPNPNLNPNLNPIPAFRNSSRNMSSIPSTMKGVLIAKTGGTEVLDYKTDIPVPTPIDGNILVKNDFIGVNYIDTYFRSGLYAAPKFPYMLGKEAEGTVVAVGGGDTLGFKVGDRVAYYGVNSYAQYTSTPATTAFKVPESFAPGKAAASVLQGLTALTLVREAHHVNKGDWVLVHAAAGGTGLILCQLLRIIGANTIGTASTAEKVALAKKNGATHVINYSHEDVKARVDELTGGKGCIAVFDGVGKATFDLSLSCVARKGTMVSFGNASGAVPPFAISRLTEKNVKLLRPTLFNYVSTREEYMSYTEELLGFIEKDGLNIHVHKIYPLSEVKSAHEDLEGRKTTGKLLLDPSK